MRALGFTLLAATMAFGAASLAPAPAEAHGYARKGPPVVVVRPALRPYYARPPGRYYAPPRAYYRPPAYYRPAPRHYGRPGVTFGFTIR